MLVTGQLGSQKESIPTRKRIRPKTIGGPLHIQCDGNGDVRYFRELIAQVLGWPNVEATPSLESFPDLMCIHLRQGQGTNGSLFCPTLRPENGKKISDITYSFGRLRINPSPTGGNTSLC
jgi:hypothetical protein